MKGSSLLRRGRHSIENHIYHVTLNTHNRQAAFVDYSLAHQMRKTLQESDHNTYSETLAYSIMPDHVHWLFVLKDQSLSKMIARVKSAYSRNTGTKIWQDGFHDHAIRTDESLINVARYIVANPLRAGLVSKVGDYPFWDSIWL